MQEIEKYILSHIDKEPELLQQLSRDVHIKMLRPRMLSGHLQGRLLKMLCRMIRPKRVLEIGTYVGYSALCMAEALTDEAVLHTIEINDELEDFIHQYFNQTEISKKIHLHIGDAFAIVPIIDETFDLVFIDGDKRDYWKYYDLVFDKVQAGGFILADNTLWNEKVIDDNQPDKRTNGILYFNDRIATDKRIEKVMLPMRDGITLIHKIDN
ncbi:MAG: O-methyltransferase [Bacteroidales bacterium]|jgi:predicted O-methyltransferase YrrM|nr:O-methyltransferase [Bacteroidales bacterium]